jgi:peptidoglycan/LPS O-acetylase OafA/YrhL
LAGLTNHWLRVTGYRGVQLFFALSGFLICTRLLREEERFGSISLKSFYVRRVFRIQPAALTYLLVVVVLSLSGTIPRFWPGILGAVLMIRNIWPLGLEPGYWYTSHFWSLAVEEHFYLLLPGFLLLFRRRRFLILSMTAVALEVWRMVVMHTLWLQDGTLWQLDQRTDVIMGGLLLGSVFAVALQQPRLLRAAMFVVRPWLALLYTAVVFVGVQLHHSQLAQTALITVYPVLIVSTVLHSKGLLGRCLELRPVRFLGRISYSVYLWQQLFFHGETQSPAGYFESHIVLCWGATFACALASYYLIETPLIRRGHGIARRFDLAQREKSGVVQAAAVAKM